MELERLLVSLERYKYEKGEDKMSKQEVFTCDYCSTNAQIPENVDNEVPIGWITLRISKETKNGKDDIVVYAHACEDCAAGANVVDGGIVPYNLKDKLYPPLPVPKKVAEKKKPRVLKHPMKYNKKLTS